MPFYADTSQLRGNALDFVGLTDSTFRRSTSFVSVMTSQWLKDAPSGSPLRIVTEIDGISSTNRRSTSAETDRQEAHGQWCSSPKRVLSPGFPNQRTCGPLVLRDVGKLESSAVAAVQVVCGWTRSGERRSYRYKRTELPGGKESASLRTPGQSHPSTPFNFLTLPPSLLPLHCHDGACHLLPFTWSLAASFPNTEVLAP
jgi:hypothetical protein